MYPSLPRLTNLPLCVWWLSESVVCAMAYMPFKSVYDNCARACVPQLFIDPSIHHRCCLQEYSMTAYLSYSTQRNVDTSAILRNLSPNVTNLFQIITYSHWYLRLQPAQCNKHIWNAFYPLVTFKLQAKDFADNYFEENCTYYARDMWLPHLAVLRWMH